MALENRSASHAVSHETRDAFVPLSARRLLALGGIGLILAGMIFGDVFAVFVLHQNAAQAGAGLSAAAHAALVRDVPGVVAAFRNVGAFLENRGTKVDTHVHMIGFGYLALMLAILQPWVALSERMKQLLAWLFLFGSGVLPVGVFLIHYVGLAYSPLAAIGWASIAADLGGLLVTVATVGYLLGLWRHFQRDEQPPIKDGLLSDRSAVGRLLLCGGLALVLLGFLHGAYYAAVDLDKHEMDDRILLRMMSNAAAQDHAGVVDDALTAYGNLQGAKAVNIAAHAHAIEFGLLAMLLAFFQPYVSLREHWKRRWAWTMVAGSALLPVCVLLELHFGLIAGGLADVGGLLVIVALLAMWIGILRYTGRLDAATESMHDGAAR